MDGYGFEGRVAVVTGAGRGIGRAHARLLAELGASVVVNDLGGSMTGGGADAGPAAEVVDEIVAAGGVAVADTSDVSSEAGGGALVATAVEQFGRIDAVVNNAGIIRWKQLPRGRRREPREPPRGARRRLVPHRSRRVAALRGAGLRPHRQHDVVGHVRAAEQRGVRHRQGRGGRVDAQPRRPPARSTASAATWSRRPRSRAWRARPTTTHRWPRPWRLSWSRRWSRSSRTRTARSPARSTPPAPDGSRASSSRRPRVTSTRPARPPSTTSPRTGPRSTTTRPTPSPPT